MHAPVVPTCTHVSLAGDLEVAGHSLHTRDAAEVVAEPAGSGAGPETVVLRAGGSSGAHLMVIEMTAGHG